MMFLEYEMHPIQEKDFIKCKHIVKLCKIKYEHLLNKTIIEEDEFIIQ